MSWLLAVSSRLGQVAVLLMASASMYAQSPGTGAIVGSATDPTGALISKAKISVVSDETHAARSVVSSSEGAFRVSLLPPGTYTVSAEATGFATRQMRAVHVGASETVTVELKLAIGARGET